MIECIQTQNKFETIIKKLSNKQLKKKKKREKGKKTLFFSFFFVAL